MGKIQSKGRLPRKSNKVKGVTSKDYKKEVSTALREVDFVNFVEILKRYHQYLKKSYRRKQLDDVYGMSACTDNIFTSCRKGDLARIQ